MQKTALEHDLQKLVEKALALGASGAKTIDVASIRTGAWTRWKCQFGCPNYGKTLCCPPFVPDYAATQRFLQEFIRGIIIQYTFPLNGVAVENFAAADLSMSNGLLEILLNLEREAFLQNHYKAFALKAVRCAMCCWCSWCSERKKRAAEQEDSCTTARLCMGRSADSEPERDRPKNRCFATRSRKFFKKRCIL